MTFEQFVERAIKGGWFAGFKKGKTTLNGDKPFDVVRRKDGYWYMCQGKIETDTMWRGEVIPAGTSYGYNALLGTTEKIILDPEAWKAVGKVEAWKGVSCGHYRCETENLDCMSDPEWLSNMHGMVDALAEGKTIEQHLETL